MGLDTMSHFTYNSKMSTSTRVKMPKSKPQCPRCASEVHPRGQARGKRRYYCRECEWHGTDLAGTDPGAAGIDRTQSRSLAAKIRSARGPRKYVITAAQNATPINRPFFENLVAYCYENFAELLVIPYRYRNPTSMWTAENKQDDWWDEELTPFLINERVAINPHLTLLADVMTQPTATSPLQGFETLVGSSSAIIGHPKLALTTVPTPQEKLPKILTTTGAVTQKNYISGKAGKKGEHHHTFGAAVVEVKGDVFHLRQINAVKDGSFMDLDKEYKNGKAKKHGGAAALVLGDLHEEFADPKTMKATFGPNGLAELLKPGQFIWHDVHDFYSRNHHHKHEPFVNVAKAKAGADDVREALEKTFRTLSDISTCHPDTLNVFVSSNHPDALAKWIKETDWRFDPKNAEFYLETALMMAKSSYMTSSGSRVADPFAYWGRQMLDFQSGHWRFLEGDESWSVKGIECGQHGHVGSGGSRGSRKGFSKIGVKTIIGHSHSPGIEEGCYQVGTSSKLTLDYNRGASGWLNTHAVVYSNGKRSLINIIDGKFRT
jgi:hypothetical protein